MLMNVHCPFLNQYVQKYKWIEHTNECLEEGKVLLKHKTGPTTQTVSDEFRWTKSVGAYLCTHTPHISVLAGLLKLANSHQHQRDWGIQLHLFQDV